jgi:hypothetical protein
MLLWVNWKKTTTVFEKRFKDYGTLSTERVK